MSARCPAARGVALADHLRAWGLDVEVVGVPARPGAWGIPRAIFVHHTGDTCDVDAVDRVLRVVRDGRGGANPVEGPLAQLLLGQDERVYIVPKARGGQAQPGRANHAGRGVYARLRLPRDDGNEYAAGVEVQCSGRHPLSRHPLLYRVLVRLLAAWSAYYGLPASAVIGHREYAPDRKIDPLDDMGDVRRDVAAALAAGPGGPTANPSEDDAMPTPQDLLHAQTGRLGDGGRAVWARLSGTKDDTPTVEQLLQAAAVQSAEAHRMVRALTAQVAALTAIMSAQQPGKGGGLSAAELQRIADTAAERALTRVGDALAGKD